MLCTLQSSPSWQTLMCPSVLGVKLLLAGFVFASNSSAYLNWYQIHGIFIYVVHHMMAFVLLYRAFISTSGLRLKTGLAEREDWCSMQKGLNKLQHL